MSRVLLLLPTSTYRTPDLLAAAGRLGLEVTVGSEERNVLTAQNPQGYLQVDFSDYRRSSQAVAEFAQRWPLKAVIGVDDQTAATAAFLSHALSLEGNPVESVEASNHKFTMREMLRRAGVPIPGYRLFPLTHNPQDVCSQVSYPCVLKPTRLAASQGVIRADDEALFIEAWSRLKKIIESQKTAPEVLVESYIAGKEVALEGILEKGALHVLAIFDKPDPMEGPFFEETIYVRPSRLSPHTQKNIISCTRKAIGALGLRTGPIHAELRVNAGGPCVIEVAARPIGGRCSRALQFGLGASLEELILRQALGESPLTHGAWKPDPTPSGVMMIPMPRPGILKRISGMEKAKSVPGVADIILTTHIGQVLVPLPEGARYMGFIFCRSETSKGVERGLREAHRQLDFEIDSAAKDSSAANTQSCQQGV